MSEKKTMAEWGVTDELELIREIVLGSPFLKRRVEQRLRQLKSEANENLLDSGQKISDQRRKAKRKDK